MARIKRGGRELVVADSEVTEYLKQGYSVIDDRGNELTPAKSLTYTQAMNDNIVLKKRNEQLLHQLEAANQKIADLKAEIEAMKKPAEDTENAPAEKPPAEITANKAGNTRKSVQAASANKSSSGGKTPGKG